MLEDTVTVFDVDHEELLVLSFCVQLLCTHQTSFFNHFLHANGKYAKRINPRTGTVTPVTNWQAGPARGAGGAVYVRDKYPNKVRNLAPPEEAKSAVALIRQKNLD